MPTKPVIKYQCKAAVPVALNPNAIVMKKVGQSYVNWENKTELTDFIDLLYVPPTSDTYMYAICCCGKDYIYTTKDDVPATDVTCTCGKKVIEYSD